MMTLIYWALVAFVLGLVLWTMYREEKVLAQITCVMVAIPLILRLMGFK